MTIAEGDNINKLEFDEEKVPKLERRASSAKDIFRSLSQRQKSLVSSPPELENEQGWKADLCRYIHKRPGKFCMSYCCVLFLMTILGLALFPFLQGENDTSNPSDPANIAQDGIRLARDDFDVNFDDDDNLNETQMLFGYVWDRSSLKNEEIINAKNLQSICEFEQSVFKEYNPNDIPCDTSRTEDVCVSTIDPTDVFVDGLSIASVFYNRITNFTFNYTDCPLLDQEDVEEELDLFYEEIESNPVLEVRNGFFVNSRETSTIVRSMIGIGSPTEDETKDALLDIESDIFDFCGSENTFFRSVYRHKCKIGDIRAIVFIFELLEEEFTRLILADATWIIMSFLFVSCWMIFYTGSKFLTLCFMSYIFASVTSSIFIYKAIIQIGYFDFLQILAIFLIIGIGADANFVLLDAWTQSREIFSKQKAEVDDSTAELRRMIYMHTRGTTTVFNTSLTTFCAFAFTAITPLVSISAFGIFAALCVMMVYIFSLTIVPATILVYHRRWGYKVEEKIEEKEIENPEPIMEKASLFSWDGIVEDKYIPLLLNYHIPIVVFTVGIGLLGLAGTTQLEELTEQENFLPDDHMLQEFVGLGEFIGGSDAGFSRLTFSFGIKGVDRDTWSRYTGDPDEYKEHAVYDKDFVLDINMMNNIMSTCDDITQIPCRGKVCNGVDLLVTPETTDYQHICPLKIFNAFYEAENPGSSLNASSPDFDDSITTEELAVLLDSFASSSGSEEIKESFGIEDGRVLFTTIEFRIVVSPFQPGPQVRGVRNELRDFLDEEEEKYGYNHLKFASDIFVTEASGRALLANAIRGLAITIPVVYIIMMRATNNVVMATFVVLTIAWIILTVMGIVAVPLGYQLGTAEAINIIMIVGLSVDYAVHMSHMYCYAYETQGIEERELKVAFSAKTISKTVVAGGLTTLGAGMFLLGTQIVFFFKMGVMLALTISFSLFYTLFFLMGLSTWTGPEGDDWNIDKMWKQFREKGKEFKDERAKSL
eukprot:snap_masked-scaffold_27-processed-gene-4.40-mRNA-1 protein AED:1.00 eAED:1.00 QI:0/-1/0/0/-1/1/1/0/991